MNRSRWLALLMGVAILGITGFQAYWLKQSYAREKKALAIKTGAAFRETILSLQVSKLKLDGAWSDTTGGKKLKILMNDDSREQVNIRVGPKEKIVSTINVITSKLKDSLKIRRGMKSGVVISMDQTSGNINRDSIKFIRPIPGPPGDDHIFNLLYGVDSLQDSLRVTEIDSAFTKVLKEEKLVIPFSILRTDSVSEDDEPGFNEVTVGFAHPVTYKLRLGNTWPYLVKQIKQPILFSILLLGITLLSFVLLYRSLLKQRRLAELKNEFISNITHELKTPIATVGVAIEALKNFNAIDDPQRTKEYLDISQNELQRLGLLVDKVLKLSMFEKKEVELRYEPMSLQEVVDEVVSSLKLQLEKNQASVTVTSSGDLHLRADRLHLLSVVFNLLDNSIKYTKADPSIQIDMKGNDEMIVLSVTDNGIGIAPEYKEKVFEKFFRVPHGDTHNAKGYGLGLSYVAQVVKKHNGTITMESQPGSGAKFIITLPKTEHGFILPR
jgi:two-component system phosphate regulon sensor histidine kinase PhoR